ncbi:phenylalanine--tRNA ligase subunit alpha [Pontiella agarivorans]|uniref:Phenylalanine--tRNA ligase alpha subunit n=1 Tax=Pontiella agarivorans TaxID=3038953 RepID=A0ABU5MY61_9BACT|nr:phenylalanine--tRNA ligase subunit alpha [Pontiella agarivorans]MDZ8118916.1 phenylalanine--tRNA ligase subunit alpha [Pontiella agarivorans]
MNLQELNDIKTRALEAAQAAEDAAALEAVRIEYLARKGLLPKVMQELKNVPAEEKPVFGKTVNELKNELTELIKTKQAEFSTGGASAGAGFDLTQPGQWQGLGTRHPITQITDRITQIFQTLGFTVADGPDIETVFNNFDALNTPADHSSRDEQDTFYLNNGDLMRCHTSPVQVRYMMENKPPIRIISPGRCYRRDTPDATHSANFHQVEGLFVDENVSLADLKGTLSYFARELMGPKVNIRFRPHFFPFTEPSVEVDFTCHVCNGKGCRVCKNSGWIEILGAGMVDPNVFGNVGYDASKVTGFAFGMGIERITMILYGISDIRNLYENDVRFLSQF